ncbi:MAG TPA: hypothetical protein VGX70_06885 [Gemmataceae bacterium]|nr:hypothetical protein [Gemmataceae bacterium]
MLDGHQCGDVVHEEKAIPNPAKNAKGEVWKGISLVVFGILAFIGGTWYFVFGANWLVAPRAPAGSASEMLPSETATASTEPMPPNAPPASNSATAVKPHWTRAQFDRIKKGMTEPLVRSILGSPTEVTFRSDKGQEIKILQWTQAEPSASIDVEFINSLVASKTTTLSPGEPGEKPARTPFTGSPGMTKENYGLIQSGMTEDEVIEILGPQLNTTINMGIQDGLKFEIRSLSWKSYIQEQYNPHVIITVNIRDGKVTGKNWINVDPKQP